VSANVSAKFQPLPRLAVGDAAIDAIKRMIQAGDLRPGEKLPPERELAAALGVSRNSLREAIRALALMKVLESRQGDGTYVTSLDLQSLIEPVSFLLSLDPNALAHLFEARRILEAETAALAAARITDEELDELRAGLEEMRAKAGHREEFLQADMRMHHMITSAAKNPLLAQLMGSITGLGLRSRMQTVQAPGITGPVIDDHASILLALEHHDSDAARQAMLEHLERVERAMRELFSGDF
jgi:GntR family transcriptional regulator, transcriptional repressor for pyruvate dehydrogenase complex